MHCAAGVILVRDGRPEEGHDAVAEELVDRALVLVDLGQHQLESARHDGVHVLRIQPLGERREARHVDEEDRDLLALPFQRASRQPYKRKSLAARVVEDSGSDMGYECKAIEA